MPASELEVLKSELIGDIDFALRKKSGLAVGKIGFSEQSWLYYPILLTKKPNLAQDRSYQLLRKYHCERHSGIFPADAEFIDQFTGRYVEQFQMLDYLGVFGAKQEGEIIQHYRITAKIIPYRGIRPDRSMPSRPDHCYLPLFKDRRLLLIAPFANLLKERARPETFQAVWARSGKTWFSPSAVTAIEIPYGYKEADHGGFESCLAMFDHVAGLMAQSDFDVALIAAGALGIPFAAQAKRLGKVGISLGGELQMVFGVAGARWRSKTSWQTTHFNEAWIDMPSQYHPPNKEFLSDRGAYW